jgi:hypothetical protein
LDNVSGYDWTFPRSVAWEGCLRYVLNEIRSRYNVLQQIWRPLGIILSAGSFIYFVERFYHRSGRFFPGTVLLAVLSVVLLFTVPIKSIRLLAKRVVAFVLDFAVLALFTYSACDLLFRHHVTKPCGLVSLVAMWAWLFFFVFCDWLFSGTPGKLLLNLRLKNRTARTDFVTCLLRGLLILVVPITIAGRIIGILTHSKTTSFVLWSAALAILSFLPLSIAISGGQSVVDLLLKTSVLPRRSSLKQYPGALDRPRWLVLVLASFAFGIALAYTSFPGFGSLGTEFKKPSFPEVQAQRAGEVEARTAAGLRVYMLKSPNNVDSEIEDFKVYTALGQLPGGDVVESTPAARECASAFKLSAAYTILHAKIDRESLTVVRMFLWQNLMSLSPLYSTRPGYLVFEIANRESFGAFDVESSEDYVFCVAGTGKEAGQQLVGGTANISILYSLQMPSLLILADLARYSEIEKVPIWPQ